MDAFNPRAKTMQPLRSYIHAQGVAAAVINAVLNPAITWLGNRRMAFVPLSGDNSIIVDIAVTSIVLSLLVSLFVTPAAQRELRAGRRTGSETVFAESGVLAHLPSKAWSFGLLIGVVAAAVIAPLLFATLRALGFDGLSFAGFIILKAVYTAALGFAVTRWVILRQVLLA
jgi:multidrug efflux pump subunit AcrB